MLQYFDPRKKSNPDKDYGTPSIGASSSADLVSISIDGQDIAIAVNQILDSISISTEKMGASTRDGVEGTIVINDRVGVIQLVLIGDAESRTVRAYRSEGRTFIIPT